MNVEVGVTLFYGIVFVGFLIPGTPAQETKASFFRLLRTIFLPLNTITFPEVLLADAMTSLSKVLKDIGVTVVAVYALYTGRPLVEYHDHGMILVALLASMPFA